MDELSVSKTDALTVSAWMRPDVLAFRNTEGSGYVHWLGKGEGSGETGQQEWVFRMYSEDNTEGRHNRISFYVFNPEGRLGIGSYFEDPVTPGEWIHVAGIADHGRISIHKNGLVPPRCFQYQGDGPCTSQSDPQTGQRLIVNPRKGTVPLRMGTRDGRSYFEGALARVRIWSRPLSEAEIGDLYVLDKVPLEGLVAEYLLSEGMGVIARDTAGTNHGIIYGATWAPPRPPRRRSA